MLLPLLRGGMAPNWKKESLLAKHSYEPGLNGAGRELLVRKDADTTKNDLGFYEV